MKLEKEVNSGYCYQASRAVITLCDISPMGLISCAVIKREQSELIQHTNEMYKYQQKAYEEDFNCRR